MHLTHLRASAGALAVLAILIAGCGGSDSPASGPQASSPKAQASSPKGITISGFKFAPATLAVSKGARVTVTNNDGVAHTATADDGTGFDTGNIEPGASATLTLPTAGTFAYRCTIHPYMKGTITVR
jgi:plastocyanin